jgi:hypothetical protein
MDGKPYDRAKSRRSLVKEVRDRFDLTSAASSIMHRMLTEFLDGIDVEKCARQMDFADSYTTLHDHRLGEEILSQTSLEEAFRKFAGAGKFKELFGGEDDELGGLAAASMSDYFASSLESAFRSREYKQALVRQLGMKLKASGWWRQNESRISKILEKNRQRLNRVKSVMAS